MGTELIDVLKEHFASYLRLAASHRGRSEEDDEMAMMYQDKADALYDAMEEWKRRNANAAD